MKKTLSDFKAQFDPQHKHGPAEAVFKRDIRKGAARFIITAAQNATPLNDDFWAVLLQAAKTLNAELLVIPMRYKNPTILWSASQRNDEYWDPKVRPYLWNQRVMLNKNLMLVGDIKIPPTKGNPLSGFDGLATSASAIFGHPKVQLRAVPTPADRMAKILTTTGVCTKENYTDSGLGKLSEFHHHLSAVVVELRGAGFTLRQLHYDSKTKSATDLYKRFYADRTVKAPRALALVMGDMHVGFIDPEVESAREDLVGLVNPEHRLWNDTLDSYSCTPHHEGNPFIQQQKQASGVDDVRAEVNRAIEYIRSHSRSGVTDVLVPSNHDDMLSRWLKRTDWRHLSAANADFYLETALAMRRGSKMRHNGVSYPDPFVYWVEKAGIKNLRALDRDESFMLAGVQLGMHEI